MDISGGVHEDRFMYFVEKNKGWIVEVQNEIRELETDPVLVKERILKFCTYLDRMLELKAWGEYFLKRSQALNRPEKQKGVLSEDDRDLIMEANTAEEYRFLMVIIGCTNSLKSTISSCQSVLGIHKAELSGLNQR